MEQVVRQLGRIGAQADFLSNFQTLLTSGRYPNRALQRLASILSTSSNRYRDGALYELCHFILMLSRIGYSHQERLELFLGLERVNGYQVRSHLLQGDHDFHGSGCHMQQERCLIMTREDGSEFQISFGRMVVLIAYYEFLCGIEDYTFYGAFQDLQKSLIDIGETAIPQMVGQISARLRKYRQAHTIWAQYEDRFDQLASYLDMQADRRNEEDESKSLKRRDQWQLDDETVLEYWLAQAEREGSRLFRTVLVVFIDLMRVLRDLNLYAAFEEPAHEQLNEKTKHEAVAAETNQCWTSPLEDFDCPPLSEVRFFIKTTEMAPIQLLMSLGPDVLHFPLSFLRAECFGPLQNLLVNDQRMQGMCRERQEWTSASYAEIMETLLSINSHVKKLQLACAAALGIMPVGDDRGVRAFRSLRRKGFDDLPQGSEIDIFRQAAELLPDVSKLLEKTIAEMDGKLPHANFEQDLRLFYDQFQALYVTAGGQN